MLSWCVFIDERTSLLEFNATDQKVELVSRLPYRRALEISFKTKKMFRFQFLPEISRLVSPTSGRRMTTQASAAIQRRRRRR